MSRCACLPGCYRSASARPSWLRTSRGGSGTLGGAYAARAAPDGYTLFANSIADAQNLYFLPVPYSAIDDFAMIGMVVEGPPLVLIIDAELPYRLLRELL